MLALADMPAEIERLPEGQPLLRSEAAPDDGIPKNENVDPRVEPSCGCAPRQAQRNTRSRPRPHPRDAAGFEFLDNAVGDFFIKRNAARAAGLPLVGLAHLAPPARTSRPQFPGSGVGGVFDRRGPPSEVRRTAGRSEAEHPEQSGGLRRAAAGLEGSAARLAEGNCFDECHRRQAMTV